MYVDGVAWWQVHSWVTKSGQFPMQSEEQNCQVLVTVTGDDVTNSVKVIPRLETLVGLAVLLSNQIKSNHKIYVARLKSDSVKLNLPHC